MSVANRSGHLSLLALCVACTRLPTPTTPQWNVAELKLIEGKLIAKINNAARREQEPTRYIVWDETRSPHVLSSDGNEPIESLDALQTCALFTRGQAHVVDVNEDHYELPAASCSFPQVACNESEMLVSCAEGLFLGSRAASEWTFVKANEPLIPMAAVRLGSGGYLVASRTTAPHSAGKAFVYKDGKVSRTTFPNLGFFSPDSQLPTQFHSSKVHGVYFMLRTAGFTIGERIVHVNEAGRLDHLIERLRSQTSDSRRHRLNAYDIDPATGHVWVLTSTPGEKDQRLFRSPHPAVSIRNAEYTAWPHIDLRIGDVADSAETVATALAVGERSVYVGTQAAGVAELRFRDLEAALNERQNAAVTAWLTVGRSGGQPFREDVMKLPPISWRKAVLPAQ